MADYAAPIKDVRFVLEHIADLSGVAALAESEGADSETMLQAIGEAGRLAQELLAPLNQVGDREGSRLENGVVRTPPGFREAYAAYRDGGWNAVPFDPAFGGMGLPWLVGIACAEFWNSANMGFALCPLLNQGAVEAIHAHGTEAQRALYLPRLISGEWTGTMNLTEPQAGSDVGALRTRAEPAGDGRWRITGQKIFITYGEHDFAENIVHLVLARTPDSPPGTKGISLFIVPKYLPDVDGTLGERNDLRCVSLEEKLGIHASPTCVMSYGDDGGAIGYMLGEENAGMRCMFTMMNNARLAVGLQGVAIGERAYQHAVAYALERRQGRAIGKREPEAARIVDHADVRRMLMTMKAQVEAMRALCYATAEAIDLSRHHPDPAERERHARRVDLYTPVAKAWCTDVGCEIASLGVQVHGGMGFIEETGAAQYYRDARIAPIYEGTNGIQAMDLVTRKLPMQGGEVVAEALAELRQMVRALDGGEAEVGRMQRHLSAAIDALETASRRLLEGLGSDPNIAASGASPYLRMWGLTLGGCLLAKGAAAAQRLMQDEGEDSEFLKAKIATARFYGGQLAPQVPALLDASLGGPELLFAIPAERLAG